MSSILIRINRDASCPEAVCQFIHRRASRKTKPDYVLILPWNLKDEIMAQMNYVRDWGGQFVIAVPTLTILP